jgi:NADPH:quinone reductase-like Zn-dependent oxidoreductase
MTIRTKEAGATKTGEEIPETMLAAACDRYGGPEVLSLHKLNVPELDHGEVLIEIDTAGVGILDAEMRAGEIPLQGLTFPLVPGTDGSGRIVALGSNIRRFRVGDSVYSYSFANPKGGFYAEYVAVDADKVSVIPKGLDLMEAGAIATTGLTALQGIDDVLKLRIDETVIIHGGSGGVGTMAIQFAKLRGARVLATASGEDGLELVRRLGADAAVDGRTGDIVAAALMFAPDGVDAVLGLAGGQGLERCLDALHPGGRAAWPNGVEPVPERDKGIQMSSYDAVAGVREFTALNMAVEAMRLQVPIAAKFDLSGADKAHQRIEQGHVLGKIVLRVP